MVRDKAACTVMNSWAHLFGGASQFLQRMRKLWACVLGGRSPREPEILLAALDREFRMGPDADMTRMLVGLRALYSRLGVGNREVERVQATYVAVFDSQANPNPETVAKKLMGEVTPETVRQAERVLELATTFPAPSDFVESE